MGVTPQQLFPPAPAEIQELYSLCSIPSSRALSADEATSRNLFLSITFCSCVCPLLPEQLPAVSFSPPPPGLGHPTTTVRIFFNMVAAT